MSITQFMQRHFKHFNARETLEAAEAYCQHIEAGGKMLVSLAGAMSTAELGISLAEMIRQGKVHAISCTAANMEEDIFNLVAHDQYKMVPQYRDLSPSEETALRDAGMNRVTDTCIPETVMRYLESKLLEYWIEADQNQQQFFPVEYFQRLFAEKHLEPHYEIRPEDSWMLAAYEAGIPVYTPGWEDSTLGNIFASRVIDGTLKSHSIIKPGTAMMQHLVDWYFEDPSRTRHWVLPNRRRHRRRLCHLCRATDFARPTERGQAVELLCPNLRLDHFLRIVQRSSAQRKNHLV